MSAPAKFGVYTDSVQIFEITLNSRGIGINSLCALHCPIAHKNVPTGSSFASSTFA